MMRQICIFLIFALLGLGIQATIFHSTFPELPAPDFILILVVAVSRLYHTRWGVLGAFALGILADFASARYLGPNAAGCVIAFLIVGLIANRMYADKVIAIFFITAGTSVAKSLTAILMFYMYVPDFSVPPSILKTVVLEALFTAMLAPVVLRFLRINVPSTSFSQTRMQSTPAYRWSS